MPRRVAIVTTFFDGVSGFDLAHVVEHQIRSLRRRGYAPKVIVHENFKTSGDWSPERMDLLPILPVLPLYYQESRAFPSRVEAIADVLRPVLADVDVVITHELYNQGLFLAHNHACRRVAAELSGKLWLNWIHSPPRPRPRDADEVTRTGCHSPPPGYLVSTNHTTVPSLAEMFGVDESAVRVVRPAMDPCSVAGAGPLTRALYDGARFGESELCIVYPTRMEPSEQVDKVLRLAAALEHQDVPTSLLVIDLGFGRGPGAEALERLRRLAEDLDFGHGFFLASELDERCNASTPRETILELITLSDLFVSPPTASAYDYHAHAAMLAGNLVILNEDLQVMPELFNGFGRYYPFGADGIDRHYWKDGSDGRVEDEQAYWADRAREILAEVRSSRVLHARSVARTRWNPEAVFTDDVEPLLYLESQP